MLCAQHAFRGFPTLFRGQIRKVPDHSLHFPFTIDTTTAGAELKLIIPPKARFTCSTRFTDSKHSFAVKLEKCRTTSFANTFVPMTSRNQNSLPASIYPSTYNLQTFKSGCTNTYASTTLSHEQLPFSLVKQGSFEIHGAASFWCAPSCIRFHSKKKLMELFNSQIN